MGATALVTTSVKTPELAELGQDLVEFFAAHQRLAADQRHVHGPVLLDEIHNPPDEFLPAKIAEVAQVGRAAQVLLVVGIASRAAQRTFLGDLDGQHGRASCQYAAPGR